MLIAILSRTLPGGTDGNHEKAQRFPDVLGEIRTEYVLNTSVECYRYGNPLILILVMLL
jgi:hypothetical protein